MPVGTSVGTSDGVSYSGFRVGGMCALDGCRGYVRYLWGAWLFSREILKKKKIFDKLQIKKSVPTPLDNKHKMNELGMAHSHGELYVR